MKYLLHPYLIIPGLCTAILLGIFYWGTHLEKADTSTENIERTSSLYVNGTIDDTPYIFEVRNTPAERAQGFSGRKKMEPSTGMLFVFEEPGLYGFWMKDMHIDIDIVWLDAEKNVVHVESDVSPDTYPKVFSPLSPALYVVELPAGTYQPGQTIRFDL